jgi:hypothetical protein
MQELVPSKSTEHLCEEIANTIAIIAAEGVQEIKDQEASLEDKMMFGNETPLFKDCTSVEIETLREFLNPDIPEALVSVLATNSRSRDVVVAVIEAIANASIYIENALKFTNMGVMKDLVKYIGETQGFQILHCPHIH